MRSSLLIFLSLFIVISAIETTLSSQNYTCNSESTTSTTTTTTSTFCIPSNINNSNRKMSAFPTSVDDLDIPSKDVNRSKFTIDNHNELKKSFPQLDDTTIARYLIARNNDLEKATELLTKAQKWKAARYPVLKADCTDELSIGKMYTHGVDKDGHPLLIFRGTLHDPKTRNLESMARMVLWMTEQTIARLPADKSQFTILFDRTNSGIANQDLEFVKAFSKLFQDQHPERLHRAIVYPSGMVFWSLWNIVKWFIDPNTRNKVAAVVYLAGVQEFVDDDNIPGHMVRSNNYQRTCLYSF